MVALSGSIECWAAATRAPDSRGVRLQVLAIRRYATLLEDVVPRHLAALEVARAAADSRGRSAMIPDYAPLHIDSLRPQVTRWQLDEVAEVSVGAGLGHLGVTDRPGD